MSDLMSLTDRALAKIGQENSAQPVETPAEPPVRVAIREAWEAMKSDNYEGFAEAFNNALEIRLAEPK